MKNKELKKSSSTEKEIKLKLLAIAYEFSLCHGYGISEDDVADMWEETSFKKNEFTTKGIGEYDGYSSSEIASQIVKTILYEK